MNDDRLVAVALTAVAWAAATMASTSDLARVLGWPAVRAALGGVTLAYAAIADPLPIALLVPALCVLYMRVRIGDGAKVSSGEPRGEGGAAGVVAGLPGNVLTVGVPGDA